MFPVNDHVTLLVNYNALPPFTQQKLMRTEQEKGGKLISSIESLDFFVNSEEDVEIAIKDSDGWKLESGCPMVSCALFCLLLCQVHTVFSMGRENLSVTLITNCAISYLFHMFSIVSKALCYHNLFW